MVENSMKALELQFLGAKWSLFLAQQDSGVRVVNSEHLHLYSLTVFPWCQPFSSQCLFYNIGMTTRLLSLFLSAYVIFCAVQLFQPYSGNRQAHGQPLVLMLQMGPLI